MRTTDIIAGIVVLVIVVSFWKLQRDTSNDFNLFDLLMEGGRVSKIACAFWATFAVLSWIMVRLALDGKMTEGYLTSYGALFVAPIIAKMFTAQPAPSTTTIETKATQTIGQQQ